MGALRELMLTWPQRLVPFMAWWGELRQRDILRADILAGITVALVLVPQSMAYAQLAGLPAHVGLYASFVPVILAALLGSSRQLATGPVAVVSLMTAAALQPLASTDPQGYLIYAALLALMVGAFQLMLGLLRLGVLVAFLSHPVVLGFTNAAAIIIASSQLSALFGVTVASGGAHYETVWRVFLAAMDATHLPTLSMGVLALTVMLLMRHYLPRIPGVLSAVVLTTLLAWWLNFEDHGGAVVGAIPTGLPGIVVPSLNLELASQLFTAAIAIALIGFMEAIAIAKTMAAQERQRLDTSQELVGQGVANLSAGLLQGYPVSGSFSRSAINYCAGARTGFASVVTGIVVALTLLFLTPLLYHLPQATLAAVIMMAVINLVKIGPIVHAMRVHRHDGWVAVITFVLTLLLAPELDKGILIGVSLSLGLYLYRTMRPRFIELSLYVDGTLRCAESYELPTCKYISIVSFDGPLYFANAGYFETRVLTHVSDKPALRVLIIDCEGINEVDASGMEMMEALCEHLRHADLELYFARAKDPVMAIFNRSGFVRQQGEDHFFVTRTAAIQYAAEHLGDQVPPHSPLRPRLAGVR